MLSCVAARIARPRRIETASESSGRESTLNRIHDESAPDVAATFGVSRSQAVTATIDDTVTTSRARRMPGKLFFRTMTDEPLTPNTAEMEARIREVQDRRR